MKKKHRILTNVICWLGVVVFCVVMLYAIATRETTFYAEGTAVSPYVIDTGKHLYQVTDGIKLQNGKRYVVKISDKTETVVDIEY